MKLKLYETAFLVVCAVCIAVGLITSAAYRSSTVLTALDVNMPENSVAGYSVDILNSATLEDFMEVSGIGEVKAGDIIAFRDAIGGFKRVEQLKDIHGISDATYQKIIDHFYSRPAEDADINPIVTTTGMSEASITLTAPARESERETVSHSGTESSSETVKTEVSDTGVRETEKAPRIVYINTADAEEIADALIIDIRMAEKIVALREQIDHFSHYDEFYLVDGMTSEIYQKLKDFALLG